jgi:hypothetical protein
MDDFSEIVENKNYSNFRSVVLNESEITKIINLLNLTNGINLFRPFLAIRDNLPIDLLEPIVSALMKVQDVSSSKKVFPQLIRIYSQEEIDKTLIKLIPKKGISDKCRLVRLFYWNIFKIIKRRKNDDEFESLGLEWEWKGNCYIEKYSKINIDSLNSRNSKLKTKRYEFLINEFSKTNNLIYRYFIAAELPRILDGFPKSSLKEAKEVLMILNNKYFPSNSMQLINQVKGDSDLEEILFDKLGWEKK